VWTEDFAIELNPFNIPRSYAEVLVFPGNVFRFIRPRTGVIVVNTATSGGVVVVSDIRAAILRLLEFDVSWQYGAEPWIRILGRVGNQVVVVTEVIVVRVRRQRKMVVWIKNVLPFQDTIRLRFVGKQVDLSLATQADINAVRLNKLGVTPRGSAGTAPGTVKADENGEVIATFIIPKGVYSGENLIEVFSDDGLVATCTITLAQVSFRRLRRQARGFIQKKLFKNKFCPALAAGADAIAESFTVNEPLVLTSVKFWVHRVPGLGQDAGILANIRNVTDDGVPGEEIYGSGYVTKAQIMQMIGITNVNQTVEIPNASNAVTIKFDDPVYLTPGKYAVTISSQVGGYFLFTAKWKEKILGNLDNPAWDKIGRVPDVDLYPQGDFFVSYDLRTWVKQDGVDLMFDLEKAVFDPAITGTIELNVSDITYPIHEFLYGVASIVPVGARLDGQYDVGAGWRSFKLLDFDEEKRDERVDPVNVEADATQLKLQLALSTQDRDVAPIVLDDFGGIQVWTFETGNYYYTKEVPVSVGFGTIKTWVDEQLNGGTFVYEVSFDSGVTWYTMPLVNTVTLRSGWVESEHGGTVNSITGGVITTAYKFIVRIKIDSSAATRWRTPKISKIRVLAF
jgi:hypothetical protein